MSRKTTLLKYEDAKFKQNHTLPAPLCQNGTVKEWSKITSFDRHIEVNGE